MCLGYELKRRRRKDILRNQVKWCSCKIEDPICRIELDRPPGVDPGQIFFSPRSNMKDPLGACSPIVILLFRRMDVHAEFTGCWSEKLL